MAKIRLDKYLAEMGAGTRSEVKAMIRKGRVCVDGVTVKTPETKVDAQAECVELDGSAVTYEEMVYYMLHKPAGVVSATRDAREKTVLDLLPDKRRQDLFPVGRLDKDTEGLLLITNDGALAHELLSPSKHVDKEYYAKVRGRVTEEDAEIFAESVDIGDEKPTLPAELRILSSKEESEITLVIREGRFHQVKRMFEAVGKEVIYLKRLAMGSLRLPGDLACGESRKLSQQEIDDLKRCVKREKHHSLDEMLSGIHAVIFDMDGTLIPSMEIWEQIDVEFLGKYGYEVPKELKKSIEGMSFRETAEYFAERFKLPLTVSEIEQTWLAMSREKYLTVPLKEGVREFLEELKRRGIRVGIASSNSIELVESVLNSHGIEELFDTVQTCAAVEHGKPAPDVYLHAAGQLGVQPKECLVFEDVPMGILAGKRADMAACAVEDAFSSRQKAEKRALADYYIQSYTDLMTGRYEVL